MRQSKIQLDRQLLLTLILLSGVLILTAQSSVVHGAGDGPKLKVGIVDLGKVFNGYKRKTELEKEINTLNYQFKKDYKTQTQLIRNLDKDTDDMKGAVLEETQERIKVEMYKRQLMSEKSKKVLQKKMVNMTLLLLEDINKIITKYGKDFGYTMILKVDNQGFGKEEFREKIFRAQVQSVLYHNDGVDITKPIIALLNK